MLCSVGPLVLIVHYAIVKWIWILHLETDPTLKTKLVKSVIHIAPFGILEANQNQNFRKRGGGYPLPSHPFPKPSDKMSPLLFTNMVTLV